MLGHRARNLPHMEDIHFCALQVTFTLGLLYSPWPALLNNTVKFLYQSHVKLGYLRRGLLSLSVNQTQMVSFDESNLWKRVAGLGMIYMCYKNEKQRSGLGELITKVVRRHSYCHDGRLFRLFIRASFFERLFCHR